MKKHSIKENNMKCNICDTTLTEPVFNSLLEAWEPCPTCLAIIHDTVAGYHDRATASEDELGEEDVIPTREECEYAERVDWAWGEA